MLIRALSTAVLASVLLIGASNPAFAGSIGCGADGSLCAISLSIDGTVVDTSTYAIDPTTGNLSLTEPVYGALNGANLHLDTLTGNADPILGFSTSAGTAALGNTFSVTLSLPIALTGPINANSSVSYSLTSLSGAGAQIAPLFSKLVTALEVDTTPFGIGNLNKGVDVGNTFAFLGGPVTQNSPVYTATNSFSGDLQYDLMSVTIAFSLSPSSQVGVSGFVQQVPVPEPGTLLLLSGGLVGLVRFGRRS